MDFVLMPESLVFTNILPHTMNAILMGLADDVEQSTCLLAHIKQSEASIEADCWMSGQCWMTMTPNNIRLEVKTSEGDLGPLIVTIKFCLTVIENT